MHIQTFDYIEDSFPKNMNLPLGEIHIWKIDCHSCSVSREAFRLLPEEEIRHSQQYQKSLDRTHYLLGHSTARRILSAYTGFPASKIIFSRGIHGKPYWESPPDIPTIEFTISHSGRWVLLAFSADYFLGIDVEERRDSARLHALARRLLHPYEWKQYESLPKSRQISFFYDYWTAKEALLKGIGTGLSHSTTSFYIEETPSPSASDLFPIRAAETVFAGWMVTFLFLSDPYAAALALKPR